MAVKSIAQTDTLETFRTTFNDLAANDFGDPALLGPAGITATSVVGAVIELSAIVAAGQAFYIEDDSSTQQLVGAGEILKFASSSSISAVVSSPDIVTFSLANDITIGNNLTVTNNLTASGTTHTISGTLTVGTNLTVSNDATVSNDLTVTNNITASGTTHTLGTIEISGNTIRSTDSTRININDTFRATGFETSTALLNIDEVSGFPRIQSTRPDDFLIFDAIPTFNSSIIFEGSSADAFETTLTVVNPTADRTITIPNETGTMITTGSSNVITSAMIVNGTLLTADIADDQITEAKVAPDAIGQDELKSVVNLQILNSSGGVLKSLYGAGA
jgi:hypothetical protein